MSYSAVSRGQGRRGDPRSSFATFKVLIVDISTSPLDLEHSAPKSLVPIKMLHAAFTASESNTEFL